MLKALQIIQHESEDDYALIADIDNGIILMHYDSGIDLMSISQAQRIRPFFRIVSDIFSLDDGA